MDSTRITKSKGIHLETTKVRFGVLLEPGKAEVREGELPPLKPDELLLKMEICNICTEDYQRWMGLRSFKSPMADGHEYVGRIVAKGSEVSEIFQIGERVGKLNQQCGVCDDCKTGNTGDCQYAIPKAIGLEEYYGMKGFASYKILPQQLALQVSNEIPAEEAAFLEPLATVIQGIKRLRVKPMETVVVIGLGTMGLLNAQVAHLFGAHLIMTEISEKKIKRASELNLGTIINSNNTDPAAEVKRLTHGRGADAVIFAIGNGKAYQQGYDMLKKYKGRLLFFAAGYPSPEFPFNANDLHYRKMEFIGTINADNSDFLEASTIISNSMIDISKSLEGVTIPLSEYATALARASNPDSYRISVDLQK